jgi:hypothetical protein
MFKFLYNWKERRRRSYCPNIYHYLFEVTEEERHQIFLMMVENSKKELERKNDDKRIIMDWKG